MERVIFDKEKILSRLDPFFNKESYTTDIEVIKFLNEHYSTHNHYKLTVDFLETKFYKNNTNKITKRPLEEIRDNLFQLNSQILNSKTLDKDLLFSILHLLIEHLKDEYQFRYNVNPGGNNLEDTLEKLKLTLDLSNKINKHKNDSETGGLKSNSWNSIITPSIWNCVYLGLYQEGFYIIETLENLIDKINKLKPNNPIFKNVLDQPTPGRFIMSLNFAKAQLYLQQKEYKKAEECFENIAQLYREKGNHSKYEVYWANGLNRVTEAAIEVYKLSPTKENKNRAIDYYLSSTFISDIEPTEATRERLLITYMLMTEVLKIKIA
jgi:tetratricopeptide (TPR) repeat protein